MTEPAIAEPDPRQRLTASAKWFVGEVGKVAKALEADFLALECLSLKLDNLEPDRAVEAIAIHQRKLTDTMREVQSLWETGLAILSAEIRIRGLL